MRVWIDLANSPHVLFFRPIAVELERRGHEVGFTAREYAQTVGLAEKSGLRCEVVGAHAGRGRPRKAANIAARALGLAAWARKWRPDVAVSHNSYAAIVAARALRIATITMMDYEGQPANAMAFRLAHKVILPRVFPEEARLEQGAVPKKTRLYDGLKEQVYLWDFRPDPDFRRREGLSGDKVLVVLRPPATMALYHDFENPLFGRVVKRLGTEENALVVLLPRTREQKAALAAGLPANFIVPDRPFDGPNLLASADLVIGAGGTMNREAAVLGTPVYSIYGGRSAAADLWLERRGLMTMVRDQEDVSAIPVAPRESSGGKLAGGGRQIMERMVDWITEGAEDSEDFEDSGVRRRRVIATAHDRQAA